MNTYTTHPEIKELFLAVNKVMVDLMDLLLSLSEEKINAIPFKDSWTAAQLATHITKSNNGMAQALQIQGKPAHRKPDERVKELKDTFLNYSIKMQSPPFIVPEPGPYKKEAVIAALKKSNEKVKDNMDKAEPGEMINLPAAFGEITKLELFHFVLYHTTRHVHQLRNIIKQL